MEDPKKETFKIQRPMDTLAKNLPKEEILKTLYSISEGSKYGGGTLSPERFVALLAKEGRTDIGANEIDWKNKKSKELEKQLYDMGIPNSIIPVILKEKAETAKRLGISEDKAWHGTGVARIDGKIVSSGDDYEQKMKDTFSSTHKLPNNREVYETAKRILSGGITQEERMLVHPPKKHLKTSVPIDLPPPSPNKASSQGEENIFSSLLQKLSAVFGL